MAHTHTHMAYKWNYFNLDKICTKYVPQGTNIYYVNLVNKLKRSDRLGLFMYLSLGREDKIRYTHIATANPGIGLFKHSSYPNNHNKQRKINSTSLITHFCQFKNANPKNKVAYDLYLRK